MCHHNTYLFIKCLERKYAEAFITKGSMRFAMPSEWTHDGTKRGDDLEGVYASQKGFDPTLDGLLKSLRNDTFTIKKGDFIYYKSRDVISMRAYCMYGLNSNELPFQEHRSQDHRFHRGGKVIKDYFHNLYPDVKEEDYYNLESDIKPAVLMIRPNAFIEFVITKLKERGVKSEEILISPVSYSDYYHEPLRIVKAPYELFSKHISYTEQQEVRIVVDTRRKEVRNLFDSNGVIELGPVDKSIASISDFYFKDMQVEIRDNQLLYELPKPIEYELVDTGETNINFMFQALCDDLPGAPMSIEEIESEIEKCMAGIKSADPNASYDMNSNELYYKGQWYDMGGKAGFIMLEHYNNYIKEGDMKGAGETIAKFKHFFPKYDMGDYFNEYYQSVRVK